LALASEHHSTKTVGVGTVRRSVTGIAARLCGPSRFIVLLCERRLAELGEELVEAIQWDRLWRGDLDAQRFACRGVIDDQQAIG
jgi:hypothetical protein